MLSVIHDLNDHIDAAEQPGTTSTRKLVCVAGHGTFDGAVSIMLAQLLRQRGLHPRVIANAKVSRQEIDQLDLAEIDVIAISYLELTGSPAELRYLIKRLRQRAPNARIIVGLWPAGEAALSNEGIQQAIGADAYVTSLKATAEAVGKAAMAADLGLIEAA
jgi:hypothetical protein